MADIEIFKQLKNQLTENQNEEEYHSDFKFGAYVITEEEKTISLKKRKFYLKDLKLIQRIFMKYVKLYMM